MTTSAKEISGKTADRDAEGQQLWPMGAVTRRTGIGEHTLRAWERRFGFPTPHRLESGHRRYPAAQVQRLLLIARALDLGYRAGDVVPLASAELQELLRDVGTPPASLGIAADAGTADGVLEACRRFDRDGLEGILRRDASVLGTARFLRERMAPLLDEVGEAWVRGELEIRHEHFFSEVLEDHLRALRTPLQSSALGRPVVLATLPDELHSLGLQIAALAIASAGRRVHILGPHLPGEEIVRAAETLGAAAVGLSVSLFAPEEQTRAAVSAIRAAMPAAIELWVGGAGAAKLERLPEGVLATPTLDELDGALTRLEG